MGRFKQNRWGALSWPKNKFQASKLYYDAIWPAEMQSWKKLKISTPQTGIAHISKTRTDQIFLSQIREILAFQNCEIDEIHGKLSIIFTWSR